MFDISERKKTEEKLITLQKELEELSFKDGLTGIANRRLFDSIMEIEWGNARRNHQPLSVIMLDIDFFKPYNDHYGHLKGDDTLKLVAQTLASAATRSRDFVGRYGGEEFVLVLSETDDKAALKIAERCRNLLAQLQIPHQGSPIGHLTASLGVGTCIPGADSSMAEFVDAVDKQLYRAKHLGRNRVEAVPASLATATVSRAGLIR